MARGAHRHGRPRRPPHPPPVGALRRPAAARRGRPGARLAAERHVRRRADRQPRLDDQRRDPHAHARLGRHARPDDRHGHPRRARRGHRRPRAVPRGREHRRGPRPLHGARDPRDARAGERSMIGVALKGLAARKLRAVLTAFAVVIGVAMVSGTFMLTDTIQKSFDGIFTASSENTDAVIRGKEVVKSSTSGSGVTIPAALLTKVRALPEVGAAAGEVSPAEANVADIYGPDGKKAARESMGLSVDRANARFSPLRLKTGAWPQGPDQVVIDAGTAKKKHLAAGDPVVVSTLGHKHTYRIAGTVAFGTVDNLGLASIAAWDVPTAQRLLHREGRYDSVSIAAKKGASPAEVVRAVQPLLSADLQVKDSKQQAKD